MISLKSTLLITLFCTTHLFCLSNTDALKDLFQAIEDNNTKRVHALSENNRELVNQFQYGAYGDTPLHKAAFYGHTDIVKLLLAAGADPNKSTNNDYVRDLGGDYGYYPCYGNTPLHYAAKYGYTDVVKLLLAAGANHSTSNNYGDTPLHEAASKGHTDTVKLLLAAGANPNTPNGNGSTPLQHGCGHTDIVKLLLAAGADYSKINKRRGWTLLHEAASKGHIDTVKLLLAAGVHHNKPTQNEYTPLYVAVCKKQKNVVHILLDAGADPKELIELLIYRSDIRPYGETW